MHIQAVHGRPIATNLTHGADRNEPVDFGTEIPRHEFLVNFRSPQLCVARLNRAFGYDMYSASPVVDGLKVVSYSCKVIEELNPNALVLCFSWATIKAIEAGQTVASCQGITSDHVVLHVAEGDMALLINSGMAAVALSRHKKTLTIVTHSDAAWRQFDSAWQVSAPVADAMTTWVPGLESVAKVIEEVPRAFLVHQKRRGRRAGSFRFASCGRGVLRRCHQPCHPRLLAPGHPRWLGDWNARGTAL